MSPWISDLKCTMVNIKKKGKEKKEKHKTEQIVIAFVLEKISS